MINEYAMYGLLLMLVYTGYKWLELRRDFIEACAAPVRPSPDEWSVNVHGRCCLQCTRVTPPSNNWGARILSMEAFSLGCQPWFNPIDARYIVSPAQSKARLSKYRRCTSCGAWKRRGRGQAKDEARMRKGNLRVLNRVAEGKDPLSERLKEV
jgi:hypothetical protein